MTVEELFDQISPRVDGPAQCGLFDAIRGVQQVIVNQLFLKRSDLVQENLLVNYDAGSTAALPNEFHATAELPRLSGSLSGNLFPVGGADKTTSAMTTPGTPQYFEIKGRTLTMYPPAVAGGSLVVPALVRPDVLTSLADTLPFFGAFDHVFVDGVLAVVKIGLAALADSGFVALIQSQVDMVLLAKDMADEQTMADAINFGR